jgi:lipopolysaccharide transport system ATP-binding protein
VTTVIKAETLGKKYIISHQRQWYRATLRGAMTHTARGIWRRVCHPLSPNSESLDFEELWALKDIDLEVQQGERVGIIGCNGAGKSTLLKILSRITEPTIGRVRIKGRVSSLLEVGTGFHPELTGRENIFLNGAILGMTRQEIKQRFDEIVAFAELEKFLDTPVKRYSGGMYVRLAFAVAAHLEPEILLVDEVLAVGDAAFQKKCLGKMENVAQRGRTVLFVSHNMAAISSLCTRTVIMEEGRLVGSGETHEMIEEYIARLDSTSSNESSGRFDLTGRTNRYGNRGIIIRNITLLDEHFEPRKTFLMGGKMIIQIEVEGLSKNPDSGIGLIFKTPRDQWLTSISTAMTRTAIEQPRQGRELAILEIPNLPFVPGTYYIDISAISGHTLSVKRVDFAERAAKFDVVEADVYGTGFPMSSKYGAFYLQASWQIKSRE